MGHRKNWAGTTKERLERRLARRADGCLAWTGPTNAKGYAQIGDGEGKMVQVHRLAWRLANGPIPEGMHVLHHCDNPPCCETEPSEEYPEGHLFLGTNDDNVADKMAKGRCYNGRAGKTHCPRGHEYNGKNLYVSPNKGGRHCRICTREGEARRRATQRVALQQT